MNREIKFRGKKISDGEWVYGYLYSEEDGNYILNQNNMTIINEYSEELPEFLTVAPETIGQYTGLKDKNGKEIYEGDAFEYKYDLKLICIHEHFSFRFISLLDYIYHERQLVNILLQDIEIEHLRYIGNIYENPELLEE